MNKSRAEHSRHRLWLFHMALALSGAINAAWAADQGGVNQFQLHGYATQGIAWSQGNNYYGPSNSGSAELGEIGLNAKWQPLPMLSASGSVMSRRAGAVESGSPKVDYLPSDDAWLPILGEGCERKR